MPARHWQAAGAVLPATDTALEGHAQHAAATLPATTELNWSAGHVYGMHAESPDTALNVAAAHALQAAPPLPVKPALQVQLLMLADPCCGDNVFAGHIKHAAEPKTDLNRLAAHSVHAPLSGPVKPTLHRHRSRGTPGAGDWELAGQLAHCAGPIASLNLPTPHSVHVSPSASVYPALHLQCVIRLLPGIELELSGQKEHS